jgi:Pyruvate/2-oxoacid:ferredoxin oxidoreductase gamma subunit
MASVNTEDNQNNSSSPYTDSLTEEQKKLLAQALTQVQSQIIEQVVNKIMRWVAVIGGVLGILGIVSFISIKDSIKEAAVIRLKDDSQLRADIKEAAEKELQEKVEKADKLIAEIKEKKIQLDIEKSEANVLLNQSLKELNELIKTWDNTKKHEK